MRPIYPDLGILRIFSDTHAMIEFALEQGGLIRCRPRPLPFTVRLDANAFWECCRSVGLHYSPYVGLANHPGEAPGFHLPDSNTVIVNFGGIHRELLNKNLVTMDNLRRSGASVLAHELRHAWQDQSWSWWRRNVSKLPYLGLAASLRIWLTALPVLLFGWGAYQYITGLMLWWVGAYLAALATQAWSRWSYTGSPQERDARLFEAQAKRNRIWQKPFIIDHVQASTSPAGS